MRAATLALLLVVSPALAAPMVSWDSTKDGNPKTWQRDGMSFTLATAKDGDKQTIAVLTVRAPGAAPFTVKSDYGMDPPAVGFGTGRFDPKSLFPQAVFTWYTGGAHCCSEVLVLERVGAGWKTVDLGQWDGDPLDTLPRDVDGDGIPDFVFVDNNFLYAFDAYAFSWAPPLVIDVVGGVDKDVSAEPRFKTLFLADMEKAKVECAKHSNGGCAGYVADAARAGRFAEAWTFMQAHYDPTAHWDYPTHCDGGAVGPRCKGHVHTPRDFPQALGWFLKDNGYVR